MERFYLITNRAKDPDLTVTDQIRQYLEERGKTCLPVSYTHLTLPTKLEV